MASLTAVQCENIIFNYFLAEGWLPPGTDLKKWQKVEIRALGLDDPPLPSDPNLQKTRVALDLQMFFFILGSQLASPLGELQTPTNTLGDLAAWCHDHQGDGQ